MEKNVGNLVEFYYGEITVSTSLIEMLWIDKTLYVVVNSHCSLSC